MATFTTPASRLRLRLSFQNLAFASTNAEIACIELCLAIRVQGFPCNQTVCNAIVNQFKDRCTALGGREGGKAGYVLPL